MLITIFASNFFEELIQRFPSSLLAHTALQNSPPFTTSSFRPLPFSSPRFFLCQPIRLQSHSFMPLPPLPRQLPRWAGLEGEFKTPMSSVTAVSDSYVLNNQEKQQDQQPQSSSSTSSATTSDDGTDAGKAIGRLPESILYENTSLHLGSNYHSRRVHTQPQATSLVKPPAGLRASCSCSCPSHH